MSTQKTSEFHRTENVCTLSDILDVIVPQKYFLSKEQTERIVFKNPRPSTKLGGVRGSNRDNPNQYRVYDKDGLAPCLNQMEGGGRQPHIITAANYPSGGERSRILDREGISFALSATEYKQPVSAVVPLEILTPLRKN